ncbi:GT4 family glycosyltransferase PelF [Denitrificimonas sp. JX-1]|uniref:GT4 family glycosyltransferase PelF n=1 Tax=Denitrificimonas halotolerans TaxID=3098930 RepID=A0ABU5GUF3_9GAMM|nr:GT4 family glycosyltransferase PelF [Denitrificimonas sp. JX-1]MDY7220142.1 GT4 family glycosyltransferase PelF [Denitrificimonas sp. JX-1]
MSAHKTSADICLLLEGTWPYVRGGVSSWINQMILGMPDVTFSVLFIGGARDAYPERQYEIPENVKHIDEIYLEDTWSLKNDLPQRVQEPNNTEAIAAFFNFLHAEQVPSLATGERVLESLLKGEVTRDLIMRTESSWQVLCADYEKNCSAPSFIDYFWTVRTMQAPLLALASMAHHLPRAKAVHAISTGYAGFMGCVLRKLWGCNFILSEHGIYTKERKIDLAQAQWIAESSDQTLRGGLAPSSSYMRALWIRFFERIGLLVYQAANPIVSLYNGNRLRQIEDGAAEQRTLIIPNGINLKAWEGIPEQRATGGKPVIGLIGRIVPIKDIKTFIRSVRSLVNSIPDVQAWIVGPEEEDPHYVSECRSLVKSLGLQAQVQFLGFQNIKEILPKMDVMVLTSISEAQPLVILEAWAAGTPVVATDVGACREMVCGISEEDRAIGPAGEVVAIADPLASARSISRILQDPVYWQTLQRNGLQRVNRFYSEALMLDRYRALYQHATEVQ